jgi:NAD(P)-dependent dehydrogenase (short-subunit alcohol dehydrogenase family)
MGELRFDGRTVLITGAGRGIGRCHALLFASRGARVVVADLGAQLDGSGSSTAPADDVVEEIQNAGGEAVASYGSVAEPEAAEAMVQTAMDAFGRLDVVVNNAGIADLDVFENLSLEQWHQMVAVQYLGTVYVCRAAWPHMTNAGYGRIVNTFSEGALGTVPKNTSYGSAKGGVFGFTRTLALDGLRFGIKVNAVTPRANTRLAAPDVLAHTYDLPPETFKGVMDTMRPELVSPAAVFLAHESCELNGETLVAGAGQVLRLAVIENDGLTRENLTPEDIAENLESIMDMSAAHIVNVETLLSSV